MPKKITATINKDEFEDLFGFKEPSGLFNDHRFRLVINKFGRCYWLLAHDNLQGPRFSGNNVYYQGNNARLIRTLYPNAHRIVDIGANVGNNTIAYSEWAQKVEAFEPTPTTQIMLEANIEIAKKQNLQGVYWKGTDIEGGIYRDPTQKSGWFVYKGKHYPMNVVGDIAVHKVALSNSNNDTVEILDHTDHGGHNHILTDKDKLGKNKQIVTVPSKKLDSYNFDNVDAIKIDVEGAEFLVIQGAEQTIKTQRPSVQVEIVPKQCELFGYKPQDLFDFFRDLDYVCVSSIRRPANSQQKKLWWGKNIGMQYFPVPKYMDRLFVPREVHESTDYQAINQTDNEFDNFFHRQ
jgi:FkbM family methyltransferase